MIRKLLTLLFLLYMAGASRADTFIDTVRASLDDAWVGGGNVYRPALSTIHITNAWADVAGNDYDGWRFTNITIPQGEIIDSAFLQFMCFSDTGGVDRATIHGVVRGEKVANSVTFTDSATFVSKFTRFTAASDSFHLAYLPAQNERFYLQTTGNVKVDLKHIIQELVDSTWSSGNAITLLINMANVSGGDRSIHQYDSSPSNAAILMIYHHAGGPTISASVSVTDTNGTSATLSAALSGGTAPYDSVVYYWSSTRANVVNLSARDTLYTVASSPRTRDKIGLSTSTKYFFRVKAFDGGAGDTTAIDSVRTLSVSPLTSCAVDSVSSDSSGEHDLMRFRWVAPTQTADTILICYRDGTGYPTPGQGAALKLPYGSNITDSVLVTIQGIEPYTAYFSAWVISGVDTSTVIHAARSFGSRPHKWARH